MERRLAAIFAADMVGYSRLIAADEVGTIERQKAHRTALIDPKIEQYGGRIVNTTGDGMLVEFPSVVGAVQCAVEIQCAMLEREAQVPDGKCIQYRVGINLGDVVIDGEDILGDGVNIAARLEGLAEPGGISVSRPVHTQIEGKLDLSFEHLGERQVKNIPAPVMVYRVVLDDKAAALVTPLVQEAAKQTSQRWGGAAAAVVVLVLAIGGALWWQPWKSHVEPASVERMAFPLPEKPSIAVLPFDNLSDDPEQEYFADGLTEDIIVSLSKIPNLFVIARNSTYTYKGKPVKVRQVAEELGVRFVLEGSVRKDGNRARITAQLIDATSGNHVWAERYDRDAKDVFALQDEVTLSIAKALQIKLTEGEQERIRLGRGTENLEAWAQAVRAIGIFRRFTKEDMAQARQMFEMAIELDPGYAAAWSFLGWTYLHDARWGWSESRTKSLQKAVEVGQKALALDDTQPATHTLLGTISLMKREYDQAIAYHEKAADLDPNGADTVALLGFVLTYAGRPTEAVVLIQKAMRLSPYYPPWFLSTLGRAYRLSGNPDKAIEALRHAVERNPRFLQSHVVLAVIYSELGQMEEGRTKANDILEIDPTFTIGEFAKSLPYKDANELERIRTALRKLDIDE